MLRSRAQRTSRLANDGVLVNHGSMVGQAPPRAEDTATPAPLHVVRAWVAAVNAQDVPAVMARSTRDIAISGPRGTARGQPALRDWVERTGLQMSIARAFVREGHVVLLHHAVWRDRQGLAIAEATIANRFEVSGDRISAVARYDGLAEALLDAGLTDAHEWSPAE